MKRLPYLHIVLFVLTFLSTLIVGAFYVDAIVFKPPFQFIMKNPLNIFKGLPFAATLMVILLSHEFSHYLFSKRHHVVATLPYFIPAPTIFGTFGAFIKMKSPITTRNALMDIGASGPIAGFVVSVIAAVIGLSFSHTAAVTGVKEPYFFGSSLLFYWLSTLILGPIPNNCGVAMHPIAFAGWIGFFVTSINLIPVGQLDGGHIAYALLGERHANVSKVLILVMILLGVFLWEGWAVWAVLLILLGFRHPPIVYSDFPLDPKRKVIGWIAVVIFIITFMPVPITVV
jgi:membrane-associated protease RseP (regulator of RpoE activity)